MGFIDTMTTSKGLGLPIIQEICNINVFVSYFANPAQNQFLWAVKVLPPTSCSFTKLGTHIIVM
jgi:hypothetical protein